MCWISFLVRSWGVGVSFGAGNSPRMSIETMLSTAANSLCFLLSFVLTFPGSVGAWLPLRWSVALISNAYILSARNDGT